MHFEPTPIDFANTNDPIATINQLGAPYSATATRTSTKIALYQMRCFSANLKIVNAANDILGTIKVQVANDIPSGPIQGGTQPDFVPIGWFDLASISVSGAGTYGLPTANVTHMWLRFIWTPDPAWTPTTATIQGVAIVQGWP